MREGLRAGITLREEVVDDGGNVVFGVTDCGFGRICGRNIRLSGRLLVARRDAWYKIRIGSYTHFSHLACKAPPSAIDIAPAVNSARPASMTYLALGAKPAKLAVKAKGTVMPSEVPITASSML